MKELLDIKLSDKINDALNSGVAFAVWSLPDTKEVKHYFIARENLVKVYSNQELDKHAGFVFAPFKSCKHLPIYIFPESKKIKSEAFNASSKPELQSGDRNSYILSLQKAQNTHVKQVEGIVNSIKEGQIKKAVLSRNKWISGYYPEQMPELFDVLRETYPRAFVYQVYIPGTGYWIGATPELLFSKSNGEAKTVSLAGTQPYVENIKWNHKERIEQELVTEHIRSVLHNFDTLNFKEEGPVTVKAANLAHLKTTLSFSTANISKRLGEFINKLHPTPAVCGLPVRESLEIIQQTEHYDREYYTGYLGPFNPAEKTDLYVNLRCLQAFKDGVVLYAGGGITDESDPEKEWNETRLKIKTLESILETL